tara:strand:+ start:1127 stop:2266 length:1140 start_codon:yes stop_codon:yes gene_type:complete
MDDYNPELLAEAKNEYMVRLVTILNPLVLQGVKSIFDEAYNLCITNDEQNKYLMTFQNFLSRVGKWNSTIINEESQRIVRVSGCNYLEDLLTCVHITQLKILTSIRVSTKQKKIEIDIPKLADFIHKVYINLARKVYKNIYLYEKNISPLSYQKNMRECEILCRESILETIRDSIPIEEILRSYIDETTDEEIIEETTMVEDKEETKVEEVIPENNETIETDTKDVIKKPELTISKSDESIKLNVTDKVIGDLEKEIETEVHDRVDEDFKEEIEKSSTLQFNDTDNVVEYDNKDTVSKINSTRVEEVNAPKNVERLDKIAKENNEKRKLEEEEDSDDEDDKLEIHGSMDLELDNLDIHNLDKKFKIKTEPLLTDIEVLN